MPEEIKISDPVHEARFSGEKRELSLSFDTYQYVPLLKSLELLNDPSIQNELDQYHGRVHSDGLIEDFCDGNYFVTTHYFLITLTLCKS